MRVKDSIAEFRDGLGKLEGREEGGRERAMEIAASRMKANGIEHELVAQVTGLDLETVERLSNPVFLSAIIPLLQ